MSPGKLVAYRGLPPERMLRPQALVRDAFKAMDAHGSGVALVTDAKGCFLGLITDSDVRHFVLSRRKLDASLSTMLAERATPHREAITAPSGTSPDQAIEIMKRSGVRHLPLIDNEGRVVDLLSLDSLLPADPLPIRAVIMAGGFGTRLGTLTATTPKPMLPVGGRPLMEGIVDRIREAGIRRIQVTTHYLPEKIVSHFGDGSKFGVEIDYVYEEEPLGTAGALSLLGEIEKNEALLVVNGDILTEVDFGAMFSFHRQSQASMTVAVRPHEIKVPYGVVESDECVVQRIVEKPTLELFVNAGIYLLEAHVPRHIPLQVRFDMPDLIRSLLSDRQRVVSFPILESWIDIGQPTDYQRAQEEREGRIAA